MTSLEALRREVCEANLQLVRERLVRFAFGNASGICRERGLVVIKPSGVDYARMTPADMVVTALDGRVTGGPLRPSTDLPTHLALYAAFPQIGGVVHTHSRFATAWAQAGRAIPCLGTTHADYFRGEVPVTAPMSEDEIVTGYEANTGRAVVRRMAGLDPREMPAVLVFGHAPFCWNATVTDAAHTAAVLEEVARMAYYTITLNPSVEPLAEALREKHFLRKHGAGAYYGQR